MKHLLKTGFMFGITSEVIMTLGLQSRTYSRRLVYV